MAAGVEDGKDRIARRSLEWASRQSAVWFHVPDLGPDGAASAQECRQHGRDAFAHAADQNADAGYPIRDIETQAPPLVVAPEIFLIL